LHFVNEFFATTPFDIYELFLFRLVAKHSSFTKAAELAGLTQSAITRQVQGMETSLGLQLLERTTRTVRLTAAGEFLFHESARLVGDVEQTMRRLREEFAGARKEVRVGVSRTIGLAYLPGFTPICGDCLKWAAGCPTIAAQTFLPLSKPTNSTLGSFARRNACPGP
jgi:hypothetical protein